MTVVTSCSAEGWARYGARFVQTFRRFWPAAVGLFVVSEDRLPMDARVALEHPFLARHADNPRAQGRVQLGSDVGWTPKKLAAGYNFRYDAFRFSKKVFAIEAVAREVRHGRLFWVDADVYTFADVPLELLERLLPADRALSCLDRGTYHSECGFVGYNLDHDLGPLFIAEFAKLYASEAVFELQEWHDSWVFDWLRKKLGAPTHEIAHCSRHHPFVNSELGRYMDHLKGARKGAAATPANQVLPGAPAYGAPHWRGAA